VGAPLPPRPLSGRIPKATVATTCGPARTRPSKKERKGRQAVKDEREGWDRVARLWQVDEAQSEAEAGAGTLDQVSPAPWGSGGWVGDSPL